jgi:hypothetical protein
MPAAWLLSGSRESIGELKEVAVSRIRQDEIEPLMVLVQWDISRWLRERKLALKSTLRGFDDVDALVGQCIECMVSMLSSARPSDAILLVGMSK